MNALQTQEQRRLQRLESSTEGAFMAKEKKESRSKKKKKTWKNKKNEAGGGKKESYPPCQHYKKSSHPHWRCWWRPEVVCRSYNQKGHVEKVCKRKQQAQVAQESEDEREDHLFVATCFANLVTTEAWLIDSGCTHHMTHDKNMFVKLNGTHHSKVKIGNGDYIDVKGIGDIAIDSDSGVKIISDVLYVPEIDLNLLSVGQLLEKDFVVVFKDKTCEIFDTNDIKILSVRMKGKSFPANMQTDLAYPSVADHGQLWHKRLGHYHYSALSLMHKNDLVQNMPSIEVRDDVCGVCELGK